jgi:hypothetical protein
MKNLIVPIIGIAAVLLGGLWLLQGLGIVNIPPLLCVADCAPIEGGSAAWAIAGLAVLAAVQPRSITRSSAAAQRSGASVGDSILNTPVKPR